MADELEIQGLSVSYGALVAVRDVTLSVPAGTVVAVIGANGAGKSTLIKGILGAARTTGGRVLHRGEVLSERRRPYQVVRRGIAHVPEGRRIISPLPVEGNLQLAGGRKAGTSDLHEIYDLFPRLAERRNVLAGALSGGEQQMLAIGRALIIRPTCILLDEPSMGLAPIVIDEIYRVFAERLRQTGTSFLLAEQSAAFALRVADKIAVLADGQLVHVGSPEEVMAIEDLARAYFGSAEADN